MTDPSDPNRDAPADEREPYEPPTLECEELFETLALACGKIQPLTFNCQHVPKLS